MPEFTSKMQYKNYEKGEFCDERPRTLDEVVNLLQTFPTVYKEDSGDDPNDPCIVLLDKKGNYLKLTFTWETCFACTTSALGMNTMYMM